MHLIKHHVMKPDGTVEEQFHAFTNWALMEVTGHLHDPNALSPWKEPPITHW